MEKRQLGQSDLWVSIAGLGCNNFGWFVDKTNSLAVLNAAYDGGINFFDTANNYGMPAGESERLIGEGFKGRRDKVIIATKVGDQVGADPADRGAAGHYIRQSIEQSLRNLQSDYVDLYQLHYPDADTPIDETLRTFDDLIKEGKVRYIGCANHSADEVAKSGHVAQKAGISTFVSCQVEYSLIAREAEQDLVPLLAREAMGLLPYFPLANGLLTGKYRGGRGEAGRLQTIETIPFFEQFLTEERFAKVERIAQIASETEYSMVDLALGWLAARNCVASIIAGATKPEQVTANIVACNIKLPEELLRKLSV